jgi:Domain of unknown function (DUF1508)
MIAEVYPSPDGWRFRVKGGNNEIMCTGEAYVRRIDAESALNQLFGIGGSLEVVVRNHGEEVVKHYTIGKNEDPFEDVEGDGGVLAVFEDMEGDGGVLTVEEPEEP